MSGNDPQPNADAIPDKNYRGRRARCGNQTLRSWTVGGLPLIDRLLQRMQLEAFFAKHLPADDPRLKIPTRCGLLLLVKNILLSREPIYGIGEWAESYAPDLLGLKPEELKHINDDRVGRCLDRLFDAPVAQLLLDVVRHVIAEFDLQLDELHNDSTTVSFFGAYDQAAEEGQRRGRNTLAVTFGHSKDHRPDLKQLLYILTVTEDGGVPIYFTSASGNVTDDTTHRATWNLLRDLVGRPDFLYVADCKLATRENLQYLHNQGGRFVTILPRTRREDSEFRARLIADPEGVTWRAPVRRDQRPGRGGRSSAGVRRRRGERRGLSLAVVPQHAEGRAGRGRSRRVRSIGRKGNSSSCAIDCTCPRRAFVTASRCKKRSTKS